MPRVLTVGLVAAALLLLAGRTSVAVAEEPAEQPQIDHIKLFAAQESGYHTFRIPTLVRTNRGTLLAIVEGRKNSREDYGDINLVAKRSTDNGKTWGDLEVLQDDGASTWGNPSPVVDRDTGRIWLILNWNAANFSQFDSPKTAGMKHPEHWGDRRAFVKYSDDDGVTWSKAVDITADVLPSTSTGFDVIGPHAGIQERFGAHPGRLIISAASRNIYSDDHGKSWTYQEISPGTGESTVIERLDGTLMRNDRGTGSTWEPVKRRLISTGSIDTKQWTAFEPQMTLLDPRCEASIIRYSDRPDDPRLVFCNPASEKRRWDMTVRVSPDDGKTYSAGRKLPDTAVKPQQQGGYSALSRTADGRFAALVELNEDTTNKSSHGSILLFTFNEAWLNGGLNGGDAGR